MSNDSVTITEEIRKEYVNALYNSQSGNNELMVQFKSLHYLEFLKISAMYRKRVAMKESLEVMQLLNEPLYWFTLTFNNVKDENTIKTKRKEACRFLNDLSIVYLMVEEFGEDNGRYHVHGFLCFKYGCGFEDFKKWHSRQNLVALDGEKCRANSKIRYLTNYSSKSIPRIRRSKALSKLYSYYKKNKRFSRAFPSAFITDFNKQVALCVNPF